MAALAELTGLKAKAYNLVGPASYQSGGFALDVSGDFGWIGFVDIEIANRGALPTFEIELELNRAPDGSEAFGVAAIRIMAGRYDHATVGPVTSQPPGVSVASVISATATTSGSAHTHSIGHGHGQVIGGQVADAGDSVNILVGGPQIFDHTHVFVIPDFAGVGSQSSGAHTHVRRFEFQHNHGIIAHQLTDVTAVELDGGTDLSLSSFVVVVYGFGRSEDILSALAQGTAATGGSASCGINEHLSAFGQATSDGQATALRELAARAAGSAHSEGRAKALLHMIARGSASILSTGEAHGFIPGRNSAVGNARTGGSALAILIPAVERNLVWVASGPQAKWLFGTPEGKWLAQEPVGKWSFEFPEGKWDISGASAKWTFQPPVE